jgi:site-specific DNA-methyltransferase (adenine-specific)
MTSEVFNTDCLEYMRTLPDKAFQLAIADPPYGIGATKMNLGNGHRKVYRGENDWDSTAPDIEWFNELRRVSVNQIIWGANHFVETFHVNASCWIVWDKGTGDNSFADCELAWTSLTCPVRKFFKSLVGGNAKERYDDDRIHPTQKPVDLYAWCLRKFAKPGDRIFDPMMGSQSSRIAAYKMGFDYVGCELDKEYFDKGCERFNRECKGEIVTKDGNIVKQMSLFDL